MPVLISTMSKPVTIHINGEKREFESQNAFMDFVKTHAIDKKSKATYYANFKKSGKTAQQFIDSLISQKILRFKQENENISFSYADKYYKFENKKAFVAFLQKQCPNVLINDVVLKSHNSAKHIFRYCIFWECKNLLEKIDKDILTLQNEKPDAILEKLNSIYADTQKMIKEIEKQDIFQGRIADLEIKVSKDFYFKEKESSNKNLKVYELKIPSSEIEITGEIQILHTGMNVILPSKTPTFYKVLTPATYFYSSNNEYYIIEII